MANIQHHYKSFPLFGSVSAAEDMTCKQTVWTFNDVSNNSPNYRLSISHIIRNGGVDDGESDYYGHNARLNLSERLLEENGTLYYIDPIGDKYEVNSDYINVKGLRLTTATPTWVSKKTLFASLNPGNIRWLISANSVNVVKGFNSAGYLVFMSDEARKLFYIKRDSYNRIETIQDINKNEAKDLYSFDYYDSKLLEKITDHLNGRDVEYTYSSKKLYTVTQTKGAKYTIGHNVHGILFCVDSSDGYSVLHSLNTTAPSLTVQSTLAGIPCEEGSLWKDLAKWTVSYSGDTCTITDIDGNKEYYNFSQEYKCLIYAQEVDGLIVQAYKILKSDSTAKGRLDKYFVKSEELYVPYSQLMSGIENKYGETDLLRYDVYGRPSTRYIQNRRIAVNSQGAYSLANITTTYSYYAEGQCSCEESAIKLTLNSGAQKTYKQVIEYDYNDKSGLVSFKKSYIDKGNGTTERPILIDSYGYLFDDDNVMTQKRSSHFRGDTYLRFRTEEDYDELGRKISEKDPAGNFNVNYSYTGNTDLIHGTSRPGYPFTIRQYNNADKLSRLYYTYDNSDGGTEYVQNILTHSYDELTELYGNDKINFEYDDERRLKKITVAGNTGSKTFDYSEDTAKETVTATNENGDVIKCESAKDGSYEKLYYNDSLQLTNYYNKKGELTSVTDSLSSANVTCVYNSLGQMTSYTEKQNNANKVKQTFVYDEYGNLSTDTITGEQDIITSYNYEDTSDRRFKGMSFGGATEEVTYDNLDRIKTKKITFNGTEIYTKTYAYRDVQHSSTQTNATNQPKSIVYTKGTSTKQNIQYTYYDATGLLSDISYNGNSIHYSYDGGKLSRENNQLLGMSRMKYYHDSGNISMDIKGNYTGGTAAISNSSSTSYSYDGDRMMSFGNQACEYDAMGNPTTYRGQNAKWKGRQLSRLGDNFLYYDGRGRRTRKNAINFVYDCDGRLIRQYNDDTNKPQTFIFYYDFEGVAAFKYNGTMYFYLRDAQGNIIAIVDRTGNIVVQYWYDAWGNHKVVTKSGVEITSADHVGNLNPFRYRGYYYDTETGLYFLQTRYYDPEVGRFLNRDSVQYADPETINGLNLYAYCLNNPVEYVDPEGTWGWSSFWRGVANVLTGIGAIVAGALVIASGVAGVGMLVVAGVTVTAGVLTTVNGGADIGEAISGYNFVRDGIFGSNQSAYDLYSGITAGVAAIGSAICGGWLRYNAPRINAYKNIEAYQYSNTLMDSEHMARSYQQSVLLQKQIIKYGKMVKESKQIVKFSIRGGFMIGTGAWHNATWKLVVNYIEGIILHIGPF